MEATVHLIFKLAIVDKSAHNLQDKLKLVLILPARLILVIVCLMPTLEEACKNLTTPLLRALAFRVQAEPQQNCQALDLGWIREVAEHLQQAFPSGRSKVLLILLLLCMLLNLLCLLQQLLLWLYLWHFKPDREALPQV